MEYAPAISSIIAPDFLAQLVKERYGFEAAPSCKVLRIGINHTYLISLPEQQYVLRLYTYNWRSEEEIQEEVNLLLQLYEQRIAVAYPIGDKSGGYLQKLPTIEGLRFAVLFSYAEGETIHNPSNLACHQLGIEMARLHQFTRGKHLNRKRYTADTLVGGVLQATQNHFETSSDETNYIARAIKAIRTQFDQADTSQLREGIIHLDIWADNIKFRGETSLTLFDFDNCGNGWLLLDIAYTLMLLFRNEPDKEVYEEKVRHFYTGYQSLLPVSDEEKRLLPYGGLAIWLHYTDIHIQRFDDFSNFFFNQKFLKHWLQCGESWMRYNEIEI